LTASGVEQNYRSLPTSEGARSGNGATAPLFHFEGAPQRDFSLIDATRPLRCPRRGADRFSIANHSTIALAPPAAVVVGGAIKAEVVAETTTAAETAPAVETMAATALETMAAATTMTAATAAVAATSATAAATDQEQWAAFGTRCRLLGAVEIARLCQRGSCGEGQRKSADKAKRNEAVSHDILHSHIHPHAAHRAHDGNSKQASNELGHLGPRQ
jgi:hypothetical protein